jgi:lauroyl/myristoyl acyltransferase
VDFQRLAEEVRSQVRERPYWTTAAFVGVGWIIGRTLPLRAVLAVAGIGARAAMAAALEHAVIERVRPRAAQTEEVP